MSRQIDLKDAKEGMWVEFDSIEPKSTSQSDADGEKPFWEGKICKEIEGLHVKVTFKSGAVLTGVLNAIGDICTSDYFSDAIIISSTSSDFSPVSAIESVELVDDDGRERITDITKVCAGDTVVMTTGNKYKVLKTSQAENAQHLYVRPVEVFTGDGFWIDDSYFDHAIIRTAYTLDNLPKEPGFYKASTKSVWKYDGNLWSPVLNHDGEIAPAYPVSVQNPKHFLKSSVKAGRFPFEKVEATFQ